MNDKRKKERKEESKLKKSEKDNNEWGRENKEKKRKERKWRTGKAKHGEEHDEQELTASAFRVREVAYWRATCPGAGANRPLFAAARQLIYGAYRKLRRKWQL